MQIWSSKFSAIKVSWTPCHDAAAAYLSNLIFYPSPTHILGSADAELIVIAGKIQANFSLLTSTCAILSSTYNAIISPTLTQPLKGKL